ncbi:MULTISPECIES: tetratricopeptide repeat protein [unclassified Streptomyces]|uniref:tetratricopeptide repeat protein n=1 Tax=unclassified Streptomyces TaxID=2593676 RepID=UPI0036F9D907
MPEDNTEARAEQEWSAGHHAAALSLYLEAWTGPDDEIADTILDLIEDWDDTEAALETISAAAAAGNAAAYEALADLLVQLDRPEEAVSALQEAERRGRDVTLWIAGILADEIEDRPRAEEYYRRALAENHPNALNDYGAFLRDGGERLDEAAELLRRAVAQGDTLAAGNLGRLLLDQDKPTEAVGWLRQALEAGHRSVLVPLGEAENESGDTEAAGRHLREALEEELPGAHFAYALHLTDTGALQEAVPHYEAALEMDEETNALLNLALLHEELEQPAQAERRYREAIDAEDEEAFVPYARFLAAQGRAGEIDALLSRAPSADLDPEDLAELRVLADKGRTADA